MDSNADSGSIAGPAVVSASVVPVWPIKKSILKPSVSGSTASTLTTPISISTSTISTSTSTPTYGSKSVHTLVLDTGPLISNTPAVSSLQASSHVLVTTKSVLAEIRDPATRTRIENSVMPFINIRVPTSKAIKKVIEHSNKSGDMAVLSKTDVEVLALLVDVTDEREAAVRKEREEKRAKKVEMKNEKWRQTVRARLAEASQTDQVDDETKLDEVVETLAESTISSDKTDSAVELEKSADEHDGSGSGEPDFEDDEDTWISSKNQARWAMQDSFGTRLKSISKISKAGPSTPARTLETALLTSDFAMQNVCLGMSLNLVDGTTGLKRIKKVRTYVQRCYGCFHTSPLPSTQLGSSTLGAPPALPNQFCPKCGNSTMSRVSCAIDQNGKIQLFLKKNMEWHHRGDRYSIPKPVCGSSSGKGKSRNGAGGGKNGWGNDLILTADQKEYTRALESEQRQRKQEWNADDDLAPLPFSTSRSSQAGRPRVGAGRHINARRTR